MQIIVCWVCKFGQAFIPYHSKQTYKKQAISGQSLACIFQVPICQVLFWGCSLKIKINFKHTEHVLWDYAPV